MLASTRVALVACIALTTTVFSQGPATDLVLDPSSGRYYASIFTGEYARSRLFANLGGGYVVTLNDAAEEQFLLQQFGGFFFIGLTAEVTPQVFLWDSGEPLIYTNWDGGAPSSSPNRIYVYTSANGWSNDSTPGGGDAVAEFEVPPTDGPDDVMASFDAGTNTVLLNWQNPAAFDQIEIYANGSRVATLAGNSVSYGHNDPPLNTVDYFVHGVSSAGATLPGSTRVLVADVETVLTLPDEFILAGDSGQLSILYSHTGTRSSNGWAFGVCHETSVLVTTGSSAGSALPGGFAFSAFNNALEGFSSSVVLDFAEQQVLLPGGDQEILVVNYNAIAGAGASTPLQVCEDIGNPRVRLRFGVVGGQGDFVPLTEDGQVTIFEFSFLRGDSTGDSQLGLVDALVTLADLFLSQPLPCRRSADFDADDVLDLVDVIGLLNFLFIGGNPPAPPFPECGFFNAGVLPCAEPPACN